jgi:hypothetical protein
MSNRNRNNNNLLTRLASRRVGGYPRAARFMVLSLVLGLGGISNASALGKLTGIGTTTPVVIGPVGPETEPLVTAPASFSITSRGVNEVGLRWWNRGAPQTLLYRSLDSGASWALIRNFGALASNSYTAFTDVTALANAENCYLLVATDGIFERKSTPQRCAFTRDGRDLPVHRLQLRLRVPNVSGAATDDDVEIRLQSPSWLVPTVTNWSPAGNSTWIDSTANDFERGTRTYDLMLTNVAQASDITMITVSKPKGTDSMCIAELQLLIDGRSAFQRTFGDTATTCAWVTAAQSFSITFNELRASAAWNALSLPTFVGIDGAGLRSRIEATFAHKLHGKGELRNGGTTGSRRVSESRLKVSVPIKIYDTPLGDVNSTVYFDMVMKPVVVNGVTTTVMAVENADADSFDLLALFFPAVVTPILYGISTDIEKQVADIGSVTLEPSPLSGTHVCFTPDAGIGVCFD